VLEPVVNSEKLHELLAWEAEYATLDFKASSKLSDKRDQVDLAKDIGAISVRGGFLVIGVDDRGKPLGMIRPWPVPCACARIVRRGFAFSFPETRRFDSDVERRGEALMPETEPRPTEVTDKLVTYGRGA
jgi:hypothetical protein